MLLVLAALLEDLLHVRFRSMCGLYDLILRVGLRVDLGIVDVQDVGGREAAGLVQIINILRVGIQALF